MGGFVATNQDATDTKIENDGWWPDVDPAEVRDIARLDGTITPARLREALATAMGATNVELLPWRTAQEASGYTSLADVPSMVIGGASRFVDLYQRAVRCRAQAYLVERYRNYDVTDSGQKKAEEQSLSIDELRRDLRWAIADIQGLPHNVVELI